MTKDYFTKVKIVLESNNGDLEDFPATTKYVVKFDATDMSVQGWIDEFKKVLTLAGYMEKTIEEYLGDA